MVGLVATRVFISHGSKDVGARNKSAHDAARVSGDGRWYKASRASWPYSWGHLRRKFTIEDVDARDRPGMTR
jgi:hypothetical protein